MIKTEPKPETQDIAIAILFFEKVDQTIECIQSFLPAQVPIVVCNNGSSPASRRTLLNFCAQFSNVKFIETPYNLGVSGGRNVLTNNTEAEWLFFVDNDITVATQDWLLKFRELERKYPDMEVYIPRLYNVFERTYSPRREMHIDDNQLFFDKRSNGKVVNIFPGGASIVSRNLFSRLGRFDEKMFVEYEDYELCVRGLLSGKPVRALCVDSIVLRHNHRRSTTETDKAYVTVRYNSNRSAESARRMLEKHHLRVPDNTKEWVLKQQQNMLYGRQWWSKETLYFFAPAWLKNWWNNRV